MGRWRDFICIGHGNRFNGVTARNDTVSSIRERRSETSSTMKGKISALNVCGLDTARAWGTMGR